MITRPRGLSASRGKKIGEVNSHVLLDLCVVEAPADEPLGGVEGVLRVGDGLPLGGHAG